MKIKYQGNDEETAATTVAAFLAGERRQDVAQFTHSGSHTQDEVYAAIRANGQEVVFKNWDNRI